MDLEVRLAALGDQLDLDMDRVDAGSSLSERVLDRLDSEDADEQAEPNRWLRRAAAVLLLAAVAAVVVPSSRNAIAGWFGLDGVRIERRVGDVPATPDAGEAIGPAGLPGPGESSEVDVDGQVVLVSVIEGSLVEDVLVKTLGPGSDVVEVTVGESPGLWIDGAPHELAYRSPDGLIVFERLAGNTLVWQNDQTIGRLEGFDSMDAAVEYAIMLGTEN